VNGTKKKAKDKKIKILRHDANKHRQLPGRGFEV
jgi:hypothetical protein